MECRLVDGEDLLMAFDEADCTLYSLDKVVECVLLIWQVGIVVAIELSVDCLEVGSGRFGDVVEPIQLCDLIIHLQLAG